MIGAAKSATTSLSDYLRRLRRFCFCPINKESNFFVFQSQALDLNDIRGPISSDELRAKIHAWSVSRPKEYKRIYSGASQKWKLDASVRYLYYGSCAQAIKDYTSGSCKPKFIACLRKPSARAISHYLMMKMKFSLEPLSFSDAIDAEDERIACGWDYDWHYTSCGRYYKQLRQYIDVFGRDSIHILYYEDLIKSPGKEIFRLLLFLDLGLSNLSRSIFYSFPVSNPGAGRGADILDSLPSYARRKLLRMDDEQRQLLKVIHDREAPW